MKRYLFKILILFLSSFACFLLQLRFKLPPVIAAAFIGLTGTYLPKPQNELKTHFESLILAGAFIGMGSFFSLESLTYLIFASALAALIYVLLENKFHGLGGKLGFIAFISSGVSLVISLALKVVS